MRSAISTSKKTNTFAGDDALLDFLDPDNLPPTPLVEVPAKLNPYRDKGVRIFAKLMNALPLANVKSLPAFNMLSRAKKSGELKDSSSVIESSSGNTVSSLAVIARMMGVDSTKAIASHQVSKGKLDMLRFLGVETIINKEPICPDPSDPQSGIQKAKKLAQEKGYLNPGQYDNPANPGAHYKWTGPQIWKQTSGEISLLAAGLGTTGSLVGTGKFLKEKNQDVEVLGVSRVANNPVPGVRTKNLLRQVEFDWEEVLDYRNEAATVESYKASLELCRSGLLVGPSAGFAFSGLLNHLSSQNLANSEERIAVFISPDTPFPYIDEYFEHLDEACFPNIKNEELLNMDRERNNHRSSFDVSLVTPNEFFRNFYKKPKKQVESSISKSESVAAKENVLAIDVRTKNEFSDFHLPASINIPLKTLDSFLENSGTRLNQKDIYLICRSGRRSAIAAQKFNDRGVSAHSLQGGTVAWSNQNLPRVKGNSCVVEPIS